MIDDGGRAFPNDGQWANGIPEGGMSLRAYIACRFVASLLPEIRNREDGEKTIPLCVKLADLMIAELKKEQ